MPAAAREPVEDSVLRSLVAEVKRLRVPLGCEFDDVVGGEVVDIGTKLMPDVKIIQPKLGSRRDPPPLPI